MGEYKIRKRLSNPWLVTVIGGLVVAGTISVFKETAIVGSVISAAMKVTSLPSAIWNHLSGTWAINRLVIYATLAIVLIVCYRKLKQWDDVPSKKVLFVYQFRRYSLRGVDWNWTWKYRKDIGKHYVTDIHPTCPDCQLEIIPRSYGSRLTTFACETCDKNVVSVSMEYEELVNWVEREIHRKVRTGEWEKTATNAPRAQF